MKPIPIPDNRIIEGTNRKTIGAPVGKEQSIKPVEACVGFTPMPGQEDPVVTFFFLIEVTDEEIENIKKANNTFWMVQMGGAVRPFSFLVED